MDFDPFALLQVDTKEVNGGDSLPVELCWHFLELKKRNLPMEKFTVIDIRIQNRFWLVVYSASSIMVTGIWNEGAYNYDWGEEFGGKRS